MIWPWSEIERLKDRLVKAQFEIVGSAAQLDDERHQHQMDAIIAAKDAEFAAANLRTVERDFERFRTEFESIRQDYKHLVAQVAGRVPSRHGQLDPDVFERDPFAENLKIPSEWLTADPEELLNSGEGEAGVPGRPSEREGDPGKA